MIIESETGSGKTEAALWRFARMYEAGLVDGLSRARPGGARVSQGRRFHRQGPRAIPPFDSAQRSLRKNTMLNILTERLRAW